MHRTICKLSLPTLAILTAVAPVGDALAASGGPDLTGYRYDDQLDGAVFAYVDITATGTDLFSGPSDEQRATFPLGFPFDVYGVTYASLQVSSNGFLSDPSLSAADISNDCPVPAIPSGGGGEFRLAVLHDDFVASVFYQYFDATQAAAVGYPGTTNGISVIQWFGEHFPSGGPDAINAEAILFHDTGNILTMVNTDTEMGSGSTLGLYRGDATTGLNYGCNSAGFVVPGETAVLYTAGPAPDSDCCTASPNGATPGCIVPSCQNLVCAANPACCDTDWNAACGDQADALCTNLCAPVSINELRIDQTGTDNDEFFELAGGAGNPLHALTYLVLGDGPGGSGVVEGVVPLDGGVIPASGYFVAAEGTFSLSIADLTTALPFENTDTVTHMLVRSFTGSLNDDLDTDDDGMLDVTPWSEVLDVVAIVDGASTELPYGPPSNCVDGPFCQQVGGVGAAAQQVFRCDDTVGPWNIGNVDITTIPATDTPGEPNCVCGDGFAVPGEICDGDGMGVSGETATCDVDCTLAECGDGTINATAGEDCDDIGETATCDLDCTEVLCGDGVVNATAGEACDGDGLGAGGETATCNLDCSVAACGDGIVNASANEDCDGDGTGIGGETASCDVDCTDVTCGDGIVNNLAGETCDGDGVGTGGQTAMCDDDCTAVSCGDGVVNAAAGEMCDGNGAGTPGETDLCDPDCTTAVCGDGYVNDPAGETCDAMGEAADCDDDCTAVECGDGTLNVTAGEVCDDGNTDDGDGCAADCTEEMGGGSTGDTGDTGSTGDTGDTTGGDTAADDTVGDTAADDTAGESTDGGAGVTVGATVTLSAGDGTGGDPDTDGPGAVTPSDDGCSCTSDPQQTPWGLLALFGLGAIRRRRSRA